MTFEKSLERLEKITEMMDDSSLPLEESLKLYEEGTLLINECQKELAEAKLKVEVLSEKGDSNE